MSLECFLISYVIFSPEYMIYGYADLVSHCFVTGQKGKYFLTIKF